MIFVINLWN